jgi:pyruvate/2-oxoglutarate dehydrogenase complex dihydrolipoamide acyltransferase (E2) component
MAIEVLLPKLGLTMDEGTVDAWLVEDGTVVAVGDLLLRLATDKVDVDVEAEDAGRFHKAVPAGTTLPPGAVVGWLLAEGEEPPAAPVAPTDAPAPLSAQPAVPQVDVTTTVQAATGEHGRLLSSPLARRIAGEIGLDINSISGTGPGGRIVVGDERDAAAARPGTADDSARSPLVRRDAEQFGVDLGAVRGTGIGGRITRNDVRNALPSAPVEQHAQTVTGVIPLKGMRGAIASRMVASLQEMAQLTHGYEVGMDEVVALRDLLKRDWSERGIAIPSLNDFVVRAAALALRDHPGLNATIVDNEIHLLSDIHVGMAVAVPQGLVVPVIRDCDRVSLNDLTIITRDLATRAREGQLQLPEMEGATFAVTSLGTYGVDFFTPVINPGNVAILGVGRLRDGVRWTADDRPIRTKVLTLSLTFDHRAVDGAPAAEYLQTVAALLSRPLALLPNI